MVLSRNQFFLLLFAVIACPLFLHKLFWLANSAKTNAVMEFTGHGNLGSVLGISSYPVMMFVAKADTFHFNGNLNIPLEKIILSEQKPD